MYQGFNIITDFLPIDENVRPGTKITPQGMAVHWTGNINVGSDDDNTATFFENRAKNDLGYGSAHYILDSDSIMYVIPENEMAYHVGAKTYKTTRFGTYPNNRLLGLEVAVPMDQDYKKTYDHAVRFAAAVCKKHNWNPFESLVRHYDITGKDCPLNMTEFVNNDAHVRWSVESQLKWVNTKYGVTEFNKRVTAGIDFVKNGLAIDGVRGDALWKKFLNDVKDEIDGVRQIKKVVEAMSKYFADLPESHWASATIDSLHEMKTSNGVSLFNGVVKDGQRLAKPNEPITRAETAALIHRAIQYAVEQVKK